MDSNADQIEFQLIMQKEAKDFEVKAKIKEEKYGHQTKMKFVDSSDKFDSFAPNEEEEEKRDEPRSLKDPQVNI